MVLLADRDGGNEEVKHRVGISEASHVTAQSPRAADTPSIRAKALRPHAQMPGLGLRIPLAQTAFSGLLIATKRASLCLWNILDPTPFMLAFRF